MKYSLRDVATFYCGQLHQKEALDFLENYIPPAVEEQFCNMWSYDKKNVVPSHVTWHEKLKLLLEVDETLPDRMDVEGVYLLFAELLIHQSEAANPELASKLLDLIAIKRAKKE